MKKNDKEVEIILLTVISSNYTLKYKMSVGQTKYCQKCQGVYITMDEKSKYCGYQCEYAVSIKKLESRIEELEVYVRLLQDDLNVCLTHIQKQNNTAINYQLSSFITTRTSNAFGTSSDFDIL